MPLLVVTDDESQLRVPSGAALLVHLPGARRQQATIIVVADLLCYTAGGLTLGNSGGLNLPIHLVGALQLEVVWVGGRRLQHHVVVQDLSGRIALLGLQHLDANRGSLRRPPAPACDRSRARIRQLVEDVPGGVQGVLTCVAGFLEPVPLLEATKYCAALELECRGRVGLYSNTWFSVEKKHDQAIGERHLCQVGRLEPRGTLVKKGLTAIPAAGSVLARFAGGKSERSLLAATGASPPATPELLGALSKHPSLTGFPSSCLAIRSTIFWRSEQCTGWSFRGGVTHTYIYI